ncbi:MAG: hypothetical protein WCA83_01190 [Azonexus sp.]
MKQLVVIAGLGLLVLSGLLPHVHAASAGEGMPEVQKIRFCERIRDFAKTAFYEREQERPIRLFPEDGSDSLRITNTVIKQIYEDPKISSANQAELLGRTTCNQMLGTKTPPE